MKTFIFLLFILFNVAASAQTGGPITVNGSGQITGPIPGSVFISGNGIFTQAAADARYLPLHGTADAANSTTASLQAFFSSQGYSTDGNSNQFEMTDGSVLANIASWHTTGSVLNMDSSVNFTIPHSGTLNDLALVSSFSTITVDGTATMNLTSSGSLSVIGGAVMVEGTLDVFTGTRLALADGSDISLLNGGKLADTSDSGTATIPAGNGTIAYQENILSYISSATGVVDLSNKTVLLPPLQVRQGTASALSTYVGLSGEPLWTTDTKKLFVGDGSTEGGIPVAMLDASGNMQIPGAILGGYLGTIGGAAWINLSGHTGWSAVSGSDGATPIPVMMSHLIGNPREAITIAAGAGAGTSPTIAISGSDLGGAITLTTGTTPTGSNATVVTITFGQAYGAAPHVTFTPHNAAADALLATGAAPFANGESTTVFTVTSGATALTAATAYEWTYHIDQ